MKTNVSLLLSILVMLVVAPNMNAQKKKPSKKGIYTAWYLHKEMSKMIDSAKLRGKATGPCDPLIYIKSLGKKGKGFTPIVSLGPKDHHSILQLYLDGPKDKFFTFITTNHSKKGLHVNNDIMISAEVNYLVNRKMGDLMQAEQQSTLDVFNSKNIKFREIFIEIIDEKRIGELMAASIVETVATCIYFGVDPFNQPAVEAGKKLTKQYLS